MSQFFDFNPVREEDDSGSKRRKEAIDSQGRKNETETNKPESGLSTSKRLCGNEPRADDSAKGQYRAANGQREEPSSRRPINAGISRDVSKRRDCGHVGSFSH